MEKNNYDVIIVGGGPAGVTTALKISSEKNFKIAIIDREKRDKIGDKSCGDALLEAWIPNDIFIPVDGELCQRWKDQSVITGSERVQGKSVFGSGYVVNRHEYNQRLLKLAEDSGVTILSDRKVKDVIIHDDTLVGIKIDNQQTGQVEELMGKVIVDASGWSHVVRKSLPQIKFPLLTTETDYKKMTSGYREILEVDHDLNDHFYMLFLDDLTPGSYFWILGHGEKEVNAGIYIHEGKPFNIKKIYKRILHEHFFTEHQYKIKDAKGCPIPSTLPLTNVVGNGFVAIGDSAVNVSPMTGEGFGPAIWAAWNIADVLLEALNRNDLSEESLWDINRKIIPLIKSNFVAYFRKMAFQGFGVPGLEICAQRIPDMLGDLFQDKKLPIKTQVKAAFKLHNFELLSALAKIQLNSKKIDKILMHFPDSPNLYLAWRRQLRKLLIKMEILKKDESMDSFMQKVVQREKFEEEEPKIKEIIN